MNQETDIMTPVADSTFVSQPLLSPGHTGLPRPLADHQPPLHAHHRQRGGARSLLQEME